MIKRVVLMVTVALVMVATMAIRALPALAGRALYTTC